MEYSDFFDKLEYFLKQQSEAGDETDEQDYKFLSKEEGKDVVNEAIHTLIELNPDSSWTEETYQFDSGTDRFILPEQYQFMTEYYDDTTSRWVIPADASDAQATIRVAGSDCLYNSDGWEKGDEIKLRVVKLPPKIIDDNDSIPSLFSAGMPYRLLLLQAMIEALGRKDKALNVLSDREYQQKLSMWINRAGRIKTRRKRSFRGHGFGAK